MKRPISYIVIVIAALFLLPTVMGGAYGGSASTGLGIYTTIEVPNQPPTVSYTHNYLPQLVPVTVTYTANASDSDGIIILYEWDFDGDGTWDQSGSALSVASYTYTTPSDYGAIVRVTDDDGATAAYGAIMFIGYLF